MAYLCAFFKKIVKTVKSDVLCSVSTVLTVFLKKRLFKAISLFVKYNLPYSLFHIIKHETAVSMIDTVKKITDRHKNATVC